MSNPDTGTQEPQSGDSRLGADISKGVPLDPPINLEIKNGKIRRATGTQELRKFTFSDVVQLIRKGTGLGYAEAAHILDQAIEPVAAHRIAAVLGELLPQMPVDDYGLWVRGEIVERLSALRKEVSE